MAQINLPQDMLQKEAFKSLPSKEKGEYLINVLKKILELNPDGITIAQIKEVTGFTYSTIWHHLEILSHTAQCHKVSKGNTDIYHYHSNVNHLNEHERGKLHYSISTVEHDKGKFVCIHEKRENRLGNQTVSGGVKIPLELLDEVIESLSKIKRS